MLSFASPHHFQTPLLHKTPKFLQKSNQANCTTIRSISLSSLEVDSNKSDGSVKERDLDAVSIPFPPLRVAKRVVLVRHGQSTWNEEGRIQGSSNFSVLTKKGESQAELSRQMLIDDSFDVCFSSPLTRSRRTAEVIWGPRKNEVITDPDLREIDLYSFQGLLKHEGKAKFGEAFSEWQLKPVDFNIDGHYPVRELWARARSCWNKIIAHEGESVLVVAHNAVNQALIATAMGMGSEYFRILVQSNCGVSVLDFTPRSEGCSPYICLNRLNQTPSSPVAGGSSGGRITTRRMVLVCHGSSQSNTEADFPNSGDERMTMLGIIQSQKTAELLLDLKVSSVFSSPRIPSIKTATAILRVQEAAHTLVADCAPRHVDMEPIQELDVETILQKSRKESVEAVALHPGWLNKFDDKALTKLWDQTRTAWQSLLNEVSEESNPEKVIVVVGHPALHIALLGHCLNLTKERIESFHLDAGSITVIDFPDGPGSQGVIRCVNYTAHLGRWSIPITKSSGEGS